ncbi:hypothetical protein Tco_1321313 [Tanacetum coccineum]
MSIPSLRPCMGASAALLEWVCPIVNASAGRLLGAYDLRVATPKALVYAGDKTRGDARSWYMISEDAKSWVVKRMIVKAEICDSRL